MRNIALLHPEKMSHLVKCHEPKGQGLYQLQDRSVYRSFLLGLFYQAGLVSGELSIGYGDEE
jgi:hypothetical protein